MITIEYKDADRESLLAENNKAGLVLIEDRRLINGNVMIFGTIAEHAEKFAGEKGDDVSALRTDVENLKAQVATLASKVGTVESKVAVIEAKLVDLVKS